MTGMFAAAEIESLFADSLRTFVAFQANCRGLCCRHFLEITQLGGGGFGGVVHQRCGLGLLASFVQFLNSQIKIHVTARWAVTSFAAMFINRRVQDFCFGVRRQSVMGCFSAMAFST